MVGLATPDDLGLACEATLYDGKTGEMILRPPCDGQRVP